jgi:hypothetical protein
MQLRLGWAVLAGLLGAVWLARSLKQRAGTTEASASRHVALLHTVVGGLAVFWSITWLVLALLRLPYPFELEWAGGAMRDHCSRLLAGQSLYVAPGPDWIPYEYPPLYMWLAAQITRIAGCSLYLSMRLISIGSTAGCAMLIAVWARRLIGPSRQARLWSLTASGLFLAAYRLTGAWYDVERIDMLFLVLSLAGAVWLERGEVWWSALAALALSLAFFTKQQAVLFIFGGVAALAYRRQWRPLVSFTTLSLAGCLIPTLLLNRATNGWFGYYCFHVPLANGTRRDLALQYLFSDLPLYAPCILLLVAATLRGPWRTWLNRDLRPYALLIAMTAMGVAGSLLSRAHWGGDQNVLIAGFLMLGTAACIAAGRLERSHVASAAPLGFLLLAQLLVCTYRPDAQLPTAINRAAGYQHLNAVQLLEREGEVLCIDHGGQTTPPHFQTLALRDLLEAERQLPPSLVAAFRAHRYTAVLADVIPSAGSPLGIALAADYEPTQSLHMNATWVVTGYPTPGPDRPVWILRPRRTASGTRQRP